MNKVVLLLDGHTVQAISVARSLKSIGCKVIAFIDNRLSYGYVSRYIDIKIISPKVSSDNYKEFLFEYIAKTKIDVIIPLYDDSASFLSQNKVEIERNYETCCAIVEYDLYIKAADKNKLMEICKKENLPHPETALLSKENIDEVIKYVGFPSLIKPNISAGAKGIVLVKDKAELLKRIPEIQEMFGACTLQRYVHHTGYYYNVMLYRDQYGKFHESVLIKIMRYFPLKGGTSCYCEVVENNYLVSICQKALEIINWVGFADFDIMEEEKTGEFKIIEINPRIPASIHASFISNINFPEMVILDLLGKQIPEYNMKKGMKMRFLGLDIMWFIFSSNRLKFRPSWFRFWESSLAYQDGSFKDPLPILMGMMSGIIKYMNPTFRKAKLN